MQFRHAGSPHLPVTNTVSLVMRRVLLALLPGAWCMWWYFGWGVVINLTLCCVTCIAAEAAMLSVREQPVERYLRDGSALVTAVLLALALPPLCPWWIPVIGSLFAIVVAKQLYGGLGFNPFNPAMAGYVVLLISFPLEMTLWGPALDPLSRELSAWHTLVLMITGHLPEGMSLDALTMATPLDTLRTGLGQNRTLQEITDSRIYGAFGGTGWQLVNAAFLAGGLWLMRRRVIHWQIPLGVIAGLFLPAFLFYLANPDNHASPIFHLFSGATMLGAFFIATDPVSAATTPRGRLYFGLGAGLTIYIIRTWGGYPDGVAFAVLLMNMAAPTIDHYTRPRVFGQGPK